MQKTIPQTNTIIKLIIEMLGEKKSYQEICDCLNSLGYKTAHGKTWRVTSIQQEISKIHHPTQHKSALLVALLSGIASGSISLKALALAFAPRPRKAKA